MTRPGFENTAMGTLMRSWQEGEKVPLPWRPPIWTFLTELSACLAKTRHPTLRCLFKKNENLCWPRCLYENVYKHFLFKITKTRNNAKAHQVENEATKGGRVTRRNPTHQREGRNAHLHNDVGEPQMHPALYLGGGGGDVTAYPCQNSHDRTCKQCGLHCISLRFKDLS